MVAAALPDGTRFWQPVWTLEPIMPYILEALTEVVNVGKAFDYLPDLLSKALYGTHDLWTMLLVLNNVGTRAEFLGPNFTVLNRESGGRILAALALAQGRTSSISARGARVFADLTLRAIPDFSV